MNETFKKLHWVLILVLTTIVINIVTFFGANLFGFKCFEKNYIVCLQL
jgi:hypothetical protein